MKKLIELANQYRKEMEMSLDWHTTWGEIFVGDYGSALSETVLVSRNYWFIKRLVENDKIDFDNRDLKDRFMNEFERYPQYQNNTTNREFNINGLLMLLSISDTPIDDLLLYLK